MLELRFVHAGNVFSNPIVNLAANSCDWFWLITSIRFDMTTAKPGICENSDTIADRLDGLGLSPVLQWCKKRDCYDSNMISSLWLNQDTVKKIWYRQFGNGFPKLSEQKNNKQSWKPNHLNQVIQSDLLIP